MKAGRELDALIAEKVFGLKIEWEHYAAGSRPMVNEEDMSLYMVPRYSTQIADAWLVHKEMIGRLFSVRRRYYKALQRIVSEPLTYRTVAWPDVMTFLEPEHFCLAALEAMENK